MTTAYVVGHIPITDLGPGEATFAIFSEPNPTVQGTCVQFVLNEHRVSHNDYEVVCDVLREVMDSDARFVRVPGPAWARPTWRIAARGEFQYALEKKMLDSADTKS